MITADGSPADEETETRVKWIATSGFGGKSFATRTCGTFWFAPSDNLAGLDVVRMIDDPSLKFDADRTFY